MWSYLGRAYCFVTHVWGLMASESPPFVVPSFRADRSQWAVMAVCQCHVCGGALFCVRSYHKITTALLLVVLL